MNSLCDLSSVHLLWPTSPESLSPARVCAEVVVFRIGGSDMFCLLLINGCIILVDKALQRGWGSGSGWERTKVNIYTPLRQHLDVQSRDMWADTHCPSPLFPLAVSSYLPLLLQIDIFIPWHLGIDRLLGSCLLGQLVGGWKGMKDK